MGLVLFLLMCPLIAVMGIYELIVPIVPYIIFGFAAFWFAIGMILNHIFKKHEIYEAGKESPKKWVNLLADVLHWLVRIDIYGNIFLICGAVVLAVVFIAKGIVPNLDFI